MSDHADHLRQDEHDAEQERIVNQAFAEREDADADPAATAGDASDSPVDQGRGDQPIELPETLEAAFEQRAEREPNPQVAQALDDIRSIPVREAIEEADS